MIITTKSRKGIQTFLLSILILDLLTILFEMKPVISAPPEPEALLIEVKGKVKVQKSESAIEIPANIGLELYAGDLLRTGGEGHAILLFANGTRIDLFSNSQIQIKKHVTSTGGVHRDSTEKTRILGKIWSSMKNKFDDTAYTGAQTGRVGTLRGVENEGDPLNNALSTSAQKNLKEAISIIDAEKLPQGTADLLKAAIYEHNEQYKTAESIYLELIKKNPENPLVYTMLVDLYLKIDLYEHARKIQEIKNTKGL